MSIEAMKMALEALEAYRPVIVKRHGLTYSVGDKAITALRQAIEQAEQAQPVAHTLNCVCGATWDIKADGSEEMVNAPDSTPPQRKPLTDWEIRLVYGDDLKYRDGDYIRFARAIEAAHGIKGEV